MEDEPGGFLPEYADCLVELSGISAYFSGPGEDLERAVRSIEAVGFTIPDVIDDTGAPLRVSVTSSCVQFTRTLPNPRPEIFWMTKEATDKYEFNGDGTILNQAAPEGRDMEELLGEPEYPIVRTLRTPEELSALATKLRRVREYLDSQPPVDWSQNRTISFNV